MSMCVFWFLMVVFAIVYALIALNAYSIVSDKELIIITKHNMPFVVRLLISLFWLPLGLIITSVFLTAMLLLFALLPVILIVIIIERLYKALTGKSFLSNDGVIHHYD